MNQQEMPLSPGSTYREALREALQRVVACIDDANAEGLDDALVNNTDARLADLVQRRLLPGFYAAIAAVAHRGVDHVKDGVWAPTAGESTEACVHNSLTRAVAILRASGTAGDAIDAGRLLWLQGHLAATAHSAPAEPSDDISREVWNECHRTKGTTDGRKHAELHALCDWIMAKMSRARAATADAKAIAAAPVGCPDCFGTGVEGDADDYGRTIDVQCGGCRGTGKAAKAVAERRTAPSRYDLARLIEFKETPDAPRWRVGAGNCRQGQHGQQIGVVALKHSPGYEIVLQLDNGKIDTFSPMQLFGEGAPQ